MEEEAKKRGDQHRQEFSRIQGVKMLQAGKSVADVAEAFGVTRRAVEKWRVKYEAGGMGALKRRQRGRDVEQGRALTRAQEAEIRVAIRDRCPDQLKLPFALWTRQAVQELIVERCGEELSLSGVGLYLRRWGYTPQRPAKQAYEQCPKEVQKWLDEEYPKLEKRAKREKAQIHWGDETRCQNSINAGRSFAPSGQTPTIRKAANRKLGINLISTITNRGDLRFMLYEGTLDHRVFIRFLGRLIRSADRKIFLIVDNLRVHKSKRVTDWAARHAHQIELFYLPRYSPELNPDEYLNQDMKRSVHRRRMPRNNGELRENARGFLASLQRRPDHVRGYFRHEKVRYAS